MVIAKDLRQRDQRESRSKPRTSAGKQPYRAYEVSDEEQVYLEIRPKDPEPAECINNKMLSCIRAEWRGGQSFSLEYGDPRALAMMVTVKGSNLAELYRALKTRKVEWIAEFSPGEYEEPTDKSAPFIRSLTIHTTRPEPPPPLNHRH